MMGFKLLSALWISGTAIILPGWCVSQISRAQTQAHPKTVQVKPSGASIFAQPQSSGDVLGDYKPGVILNPILKVFSNEGQAWFKVGDHWIPAASLKELENASTAAAEEIDPTPPPTSPPETVSDPLKGQPLKPPVPPEQPLAPERQMAEVVVTDPEVEINVRAAPSIESEAKLIVQSGETGEILQQTSGADTYTWYKLKFRQHNGVEGWIRGDFINVEPQRSSSSANGSQRQAV